MISVFCTEIGLTYLILEVVAEIRPSRWESGIGSDPARFEDNSELATRGKWDTANLGHAVEKVL